MCVCVHIYSFHSSTPCIYIYNQYLSSAHELTGHGISWIKTKQKLTKLSHSVLCLFLRSSNSVYPRSARSGNNLFQKGGSIAFSGKPPQNSCWLSCTAPLWKIRAKQPDLPESFLGLCPACPKALDAPRTPPTFTKKPHRKGFRIHPPARILAERSPLTEVTSVPVMIHTNARSRWTPVPFRACLPLKGIACEAPKKKLKQLGES